MNPVSRSTKSKKTVESVSRASNGMKKIVIKQTPTTQERNNIGAHSELLADLLFHRGIKLQKQAETFLNPDYETHRHDPYLFRDMKKAVTRFLKAIETKEMIGVFSDYDADGIPGAVMFQDFLQRILYDRFHIYIPHRHEEGYGLNKDAIDELKEKGVTLLITIDCGIRDHEHVLYANSLGIDVIVTDHHEPGEALPEAHAVLDQKRNDCTYPFKGLCGTGVAFKFIEAILVRDRLGLPKDHEKWFLDMVGLATLSDMVPLVDENRVFATYGLQVLRKTSRPGLRLLYQTLKLPVEKLSEDDISFMITPRINAASRMAHPEDAFLVLSTQDRTAARDGVLHLEKINQERKGLVASIVKEVKKRLKQREVSNVIVIGDPAWKPSVLGLVAGKLADEHSVPVFVWGREGGEKIKGSCRSGGGVDVVSLMESLAENFLEFGGHKEAGGFSLVHDAVFDLEEKMREKIVALNLGGREEVVEADRKIFLDDIHEQMIVDVNKLSPFGIKNHKPIFLLEKIKPLSIRTFGKERNHLEVVFQKITGEKIKGIYFFVTDDLLLRLKGGREAVDFLVHVEESFWNGKREVRLRIIDVV